MGIFGDKDHIGKKKELHQDMKGLKYVKKDAKSAFEKAAKDKLHYGLSKKESKEIIHKLERAGEIDHESAYKLKKNL